MWYLLHVGILLGLFFDPEDGGDTYLKNHQLTYSGLHSIISQKTEVLQILHGCQLYEEPSASML
jgi:hypothetical protein